MLYWIMSNAKYTLEEVNNWNWNLRDIDLSRQYNLTRERVRQLRKQLNKPKSEFHKHGVASIEFANRINELKGLTYNEMAQKLHKNYFAAYALARRFGIHTNRIQIHACKTKREDSKEIVGK